MADNPHLHLVFSERVNDGVARAAEQWFRRAAPKGGDPAAGGARKSERTKPRAWLEETRQAWAAEMNLAFDRAGVADRVTPESHAAQRVQAREADDAAAEERLLFNPPSAHIGPAAKRRWEDRSSGAPERKPDRYVAYEEVSASAREARSAHARDAAEAPEARSRVEPAPAADGPRQERRARSIGRSRRTSSHWSCSSWTAWPSPDRPSARLDGTGSGKSRTRLKPWRARVFPRSILARPPPCHPSRRATSAASTVARDLHGLPVRSRMPLSRITQGTMATRPAGRGRRAAGEGRSDTQPRCGRG